MHKKSPSLVATVSLLLLGGFDSAAAQQDDPLLEIRMGREAPAPGHVYMEAPTREAPLHVAEQAVLSDAAIETMVAEVRDSVLILTFTLTNEGATRLASAVRDKVGTRVAFFIDSHPAGTSVIRENLMVPPAQPIQLWFEMPQSTAERLASEIAERWPASP